MGVRPEAHNDFIFAIIGEELGIIGCFVVILLYAVFIYAIFRIARRVTDPFQRLTAGACGIWLAGQAYINMGAVAGLLPVTGIPLPLISAGGSSLVVTMFALGMLASFARNEPAAARALRARGSTWWSRLVRVPLPPAPQLAGHSAAPPARTRSLSSLPRLVGPRTAPSLDVGESRNPRKDI